VLEHTTFYLMNRDICDVCCSVLLAQGNSI
jgi:hypothetical protein